MTQRTTTEDEAHLPWHSSESQSRETLQERKSRRPLDFGSFYCCCVWVEFDKFEFLTDRFSNL
jgi:hypothetical protein